MIELTERFVDDHDSVPAMSIVLSHEERSRCRLRTTSTTGEEVHVLVSRGQPLSVGERLRSRCGRDVLVEGALEDVVTAASQYWQTIARACYHLGNRHVKVQVGQRWLRITPDHVLEEMLDGLGLTLIHERDIFMPEDGAYAHEHAH